MSSNTRVGGGSQKLGKQNYNLLTWKLVLLAQPDTVPAPLAEGDFYLGIEISASVIFANRTDVCLATRKYQLLCYDLPV